MNKATVYKEYGIEYKAGKINAPGIGFINELLVNGNEKIGKGCYHFSTLPGTGYYKAELTSGDPMEIKGTCACDCKGCYAKTGNYRFKNTIKSLAIRTFVARMYPDFMRRAILAQIKADNIQLCRIHASGDFFSAEYVQAWKEIVKDCPSTVFWTYTKNKAFENAFDEYENANIVKSLLPGGLLNYGHCGYIISMYQALKESGASVYICRCGIDKNQHCVNCKGCSKNNFVLFIEHSTEYNAESDSLFPILKNIIESQARPE